MSHKDVAYELAAEFGAPFGLSADEVLSKNNSKSYATARRGAYLAALERHGWSYPEIAAAFGRVEVHHTIRGQRRRKKGSGPRET